MQVTAAVKAAANLSVPSPGAYASPGKYGSTAWHDIVFELWFWRAIRPFKSVSFYNHPCLPTLQTAYASIGVGLPYLPVQVASPPQPQIKNLFDAAASLKMVGNKSPVFPSKCSHMIMPWEFPVWDNKFVGNTSGRMLVSLNDWPDLDVQNRLFLSHCLQQRFQDYWCYRHYLLLAWDTLPIQQQNALIKQLNATMSQNPWQFFPYRTKIPELCLA
jgi:hypothetical protein